MYSKIEVRIVKGSHVNYQNSKSFPPLIFSLVNKQINDKERVTAAFECDHVMELLNVLCDSTITPRTTEK